MARKKISEYRAKQLLAESLGASYEGVSVNNETLLAELASEQRYAVKVDQGVKGRFKKGLVALDKQADEIPQIIEAFRQKGYDQFLIEPVVSHDPSDEKYLSFERTRDGIRVLFSNSGGVNVEDKQGEIREVVLTDAEEQRRTGSEEVCGALQISIETFEKLLQVFEDSYLSFLEINPLVVKDGNVTILDSAVEVDSTAEFFVGNRWTEEDFVESGKKKTEEELHIKALAAKSPAAFSLTILNLNGAVGMLLSSGGASIVTADEVGNEGFGKELLNYGEYSGGPNAEETYIYAKNILSLLLKSEAPKKVLIIAGGVANFTDIRITFRGVIKALDEVANELRKQNIKVFVRRGGPNQKEGLQMMKAFLEKENLYGCVEGPDMVLTDVVDQAIGHLKGEQ